MYSAWFRSTFLRFFKFVQIKEGGSNFSREPILQNVWITWSPLLFFNFKSFLDPNSLSFIRFQSILHESGRFFSESWNVYKLKSGDRSSGGNQFCRMSELFCRPFCISILKEQIIQTFCKISSPQKLGPPSLICTNFRTLRKIFLIHTEWTEI